MSNSSLFKEIKCQLKSFMLDAFKNKIDSAVRFTSFPDDFYDFRGVYLVEDTLGFDLIKVNAVVYQIEKDFYWVQTDNNSLEQDFDLRNVIEFRLGFYKTPKQILDAVMDKLQIDELFHFSLEDNRGGEFILNIDYESENENDSISDYSYIHLRRYEIEFDGKYYNDSVSLIEDIKKYALNLIVLADSSYN